eukprot:CAMPEP_0179266014 /NCGR_PEP_ID=MMETSP0797-20121207/29197_1 /TAXON_ID=47934 /ORGANISM="Dinophysis acuminata, Strain DAEP01" /LENGTH=55 /DNA_ID=CAMNT_0020974233 /DNA_START=335 /DNA_END=498 /DNA_ORIENTATION=-
MRRFQGNSGTYMPAYSAPATRESRTHAEARVAEEAQRGPRLRAGRGAGARPPDGP